MYKFCLNCIDFFLNLNLLSNFVVGFINKLKEKHLQSMKKGLKKLGFLVAVATICALSLGNAQAQDAAKPEKKSSILIGVKGGVTVNKFQVSSSMAATEYYSGGQALAFAHINFNSWVGTALEVGFSQSGAARFNRQDGSVPFTNGVVDYRLSNVQANFLTYFKLPILSVYEPKIFFGPSMDANVYATGNRESVVFDRTTKTRTDATNSFKSMDWAMIVGLGLDFDIKFATLMVDARYRHGITDINNARGLGSNADVRTRGWAVNVGLGFKIGK